jgi:hypothetical protein
MRAITRGLWRAWAAGLPGALVGIWLVGLVTPRTGSSYAHADALHWARCSACGGICRVLAPETNCVACQMHPQRLARGSSAPRQQVRQQWGARYRRTPR